MRILITLGRNPDSCADVMASAGSFPWPAGTLFSVLTVAEVVPPTPAIELAPVAGDVTDIQRDADAEAQTIAASAAAELRGRGFYADGIAKEGDPASVIVDH